MTTLHQIHFRSSTMKFFLAVCFVSLAVVSAQPPNKECLENRPKVRPGDCCSGLSKLIDETALATCKAKFPEPTPPAGVSTPAPGTDGRRGPRHGPGASCVIGCYLNQTNVYKNGALDKSAAVTVLGKSLDASMKKVLATSIDTCLAKQKEFQDKFGKDPSKDGHEGKGPERPDMPMGPMGPKPDMPHCSREPMFLVRCVEMELYKNCPTANKVNSADCKNMATWMDKCKPAKKD